jgi:hypothetical protein
VYVYGPREAGTEDLTGCHFQAQKFAMKSCMCQCAWVLLCTCAWVLMRLSINAPSRVMALFLNSLFQGMREPCRSRCLPEDLGLHWLISIVYSCTNRYVVCVAHTPMHSHAHTRTHTHKLTCTRTHTYRNLQPTWWGSGSKECSAAVEGCYLCTHSGMVCLKESMIRPFSQQLWSLGELLCYKY